MTLSNLHPRQRQFLKVLWHAGRLSRRELHQQTGVRPNTVGSDAAALMRLGIVRECDSAGSSRGRPRVPLEIDPTRRNVIGLAIRPKSIEAIRLNLQGHPSGQQVMRETAHPEEIVQTVRDVLEEMVDKRTLAVGVSTPGFVDTEERSLLFSSATQSSGVIHLQTAFAPAARVSVVLENDMHALAARWLLTQSAAREDVLLVYFEDDALGGALLIDGRPNRGCVTGANELGHTRLPVETDTCYCGQTGCLERIVSTRFLKRLNEQSGLSSSQVGSSTSQSATLLERVNRFDGSDAGIKTIVEHLSTGLANAANFTRVNRLVLVSDFTRPAPFADALTSAVRRKLLQELAGRIRIDTWDQPSTRLAENAGWLALASLYVEGWER